MRLLGAAATLLAFTSIANAAPLATLSDDVEGTKAPEVIEVGADGVVRIAGRRAVDLQLAAVERARVRVARYDGRAVLLVEVSTRTVHEAVVLERAGTAWSISARFEVGGVGLDKDYALEVEATPTQIFRYQQRSNIRRCDGKPAFLFPEGYVPIAKRDVSFPDRAFRGVTPQIVIDETAPRLTAKIDQQPASPPLLYKAMVASTQPGVRDAGGLTIPAELDDGRVDTAWVEELSTDAQGQFFTFEPRLSGVQARQLRIVPGRHTTATALKLANRPRELAIATAAASWRVEIPDVTRDPLGTAYVVDLPVAVTGCVTVILGSTYPGSSGQTAIAELEVFADGERAGGGDTMLAKVVADGKDGATSAAQALARRGATGAAAIDAEIARTTDPLARRRLIAVLVKIQDPAAGPSLARAATEGWVTGPALLDLIDALARNGLVQELHDLAGNGSLALEARIAAARRLGTGPRDLPLLVDLAGTGPHELRRAVIDRLSAAPAAVLVDAATRNADPPAAGDLWRALTRHARTEAAARAGALAAQLAALPGAADYERRYRLVDGIATLGDAAAMRTLDALLRGLPAGAQASALRQVAIRAVGYAPRPEAIKLVLGFAQDPDPGVRLAVLTALAGAETDVSDPWHTADGPDGIDRVIITALSGDSWPEIRRRAASTLGARCQRIGPAKALGDAVAKDRAIDVRVDALTALVQCRASGIDQLLAKTWDDGKAPIELRAQAVGLAVALGDPRLGAVLVGKFTRWRGAAIESAEALALAQRAAAAIAMLDAPGAAPALIAALDDSAFPEIVTAAALALGALGPNCPPAAKAKLDLIARSDEQAAVAAKRAAAQCGR